MEKVTYELRLLCTNCMHKWDETIPKGYEFFSHGYTHAAGYGISEYSAYENKINCPNCGCNTVRSENWDETNRRIAEEGAPGRDRSRTDEQDKPSILDEEWEYELAPNQVYDTVSQCLADFDEWRPQIAALPEMARALVMVRDILKGAWIADESVKPLSGEGRLMKWNANLGQEIHDKRHVIDAILKKAGIE